MVVLLVVGGIGLNCGGKSGKLVGTWSASRGCGPVNVTFDRDGTGELTSPMESETFRWKIEGEELVITHESGQTNRMRFELEDGKLVLHLQDGTVWVFYR